jgi:hypothetical protein
MKQLVLLFLLLVSPRSLLAQAITMKITLRDGSEVKLPIDDVRSMKFTKLALPEYRAMRVEPHRMTDVEHDHIYTEYVDSLYFALTLQTKEPRIYMPVHVDRTNSSLKYETPPDERLTLQFFRYRRNLTLTEMPRSYDDPTLIGHQLATMASSFWRNGELYGGDPVRWFKLDDSYRCVADSVLSYTPSAVFEVDGSGTKLLLVRPWVNSPREHGKLIEVDLVTGIEDTLTKDTVVSHARYLPYSQDILYYSFGNWEWWDNKIPDNAGFYLLDRKTNQSSLILPYFRSLYSGQIEFDISPDGRKLLFTRDPAGANPAVICEYDLQSKKFDTLPATFDRNLLWVEYDSTGSRILFATAPDYQDSLNRSGLVGIVDRMSGAKQMIDVAPDNEFLWDVKMPRWSTDEKVISVSCGTGFAWGPFYQLFVRPLE